MKKIIIILSLLIIVVAIGFLIAKKDQSYSATDVLENADFNVKNPTITIHTVDTDKEDIYTQIEIPEETQQKLIQAFQNAKFDKTTINPVDYDYRITISLNTGYTMYLVSDKKSLNLLSNHENYAIVNDNDFFSILEKATK
jgi:isocitrate dehydrogenase